MTKAQLRQLIAENRLEEAIRELLALTHDTRFQQDVVLLSSRFSEYKSLQIKNIESPADLELRRSQITHALLAVVEQLPDSAPTGGGVLPPTGSPVFSGTGDGKGFPGSGTGDGRLPSKMPFWFSVAAFAALLAISLFVPGWAQQNNTLSKTLLALAAAGVAATLPGFLNFEINNFLKAGGALAAFVLVFLVNPAKEEAPFTLAVRLQPRPHSANYPPLKNVELEIWNKNEWVKAKFSEDGVADFKNLLPELVGKQVPMRWKAEFYRPAKDSLLVSPPSVTLDVVPDGSLERVFGKITNPRGQVFSGVVVEVEGRFDTTDAAGNYDLRIPPNLQKTHYLLHATTKGFQPARHEVWPASGAMNFSMISNSK